MNKRNVLNLVLLVGVAVLGLVAWLEPGHKPPPKPPKLTALTPGKVQTIRIVRNKGKAIELKRVGDGWQMQAPIAAPANDWQVQSLLRVAQTQSLGEMSASGLDLAEYGLDKPAARLFLDKLELDFGNNTPIDNRRYVLIGNTVHTIQDVTYYHLIGRYTGFVSPRLLPQHARIEGLELPDIKLTLTDGKWEPQPKPAHYSADDVTRMIDAWSYASSLSVNPYDVLKVKPGAKPQEVQVRLAGHKEPVVFRIVARTPDLILARPDLGIEYHLPKDQAKDMLTLSGKAAAKKPAAPAKP